VLLLFFQDSKLSKPPKPASNVVRAKDECKDENAEEMETDVTVNGEVVLTSTVARGNDAEIHTVLENYDFNVSLLLSLTNMMNLIIYDDMMLYESFVFQYNKLGIQPIKCFVCISAW